MALRQLAERNTGGVVVQLFWDDSAPLGSDVFVDYRDEHEGVFFTFRPPREHALEAFYHPNAFAGGAEQASTAAKAA
jgi:hypothetical protein